MIKGGVVADVMKPNIVAYKCTITCGVFHVLGWCDICTGLVFLLVYALDEYVVGVMCLLDCNVALWSL